MRIKEQETRLTLQEHYDDDDIYLYLCSFQVAYFCALKMEEKYFSEIFIAICQFTEMLLLTVQESVHVSLLET